MVTLFEILLKIVNYSIVQFKSDHLKTLKNRMSTFAGYSTLHWFLCFEIKQYWSHYLTVIGTPTHLLRFHLDRPAFPPRYRTQWNRLLRAELDHFQLLVIRDLPHAQQLIFKNFFRSF